MAQRVRIPQGLLAACCQYCLRIAPIWLLLGFANHGRALDAKVWRLSASNTPRSPNLSPPGVSGAPYKAGNRQASGAKAPPTLAQLCRLALFLFCVSRDPRRLPRRPVRFPALQKIWGPKMRRARLAGRRFAAICAATKRDGNIIWFSIRCVIPVKESLLVHYARTKLVGKVIWINIC